MKPLSVRMLVLLLLLFSFFSYADNGDLQEKTEINANYYSEFEQRHVQKERKRLDKEGQLLQEKMDLYFDEKTGKYKPGITDKDKAQYFLYFVDLRELGNQRMVRPSGYYKIAYDRFDRTFVQPVVAQNVLHQAEQEIQEILDQCVQNSTPKDSLYDLYTDLPQFLGDSLPTYSIEFSDERRDDDRYLTRSYLYGRVDRCAYYLYDDPYKYDLSDFDYTPKTEHYQKIEKLYERAYLKIRAVGLLRKLPGAHYPKSFVRAHADKTGLTKYIQQKEKEAGRHLPHKYLAADYFGSHEQWVLSLNNYINIKTNNLNTSGSDKE